MDKYCNLLFILFSLRYNVHDKHYYSILLLYEIWLKWLLYEETGWDALTLHKIFKNNTMEMMVFIILCVCVYYYCVVKWLLVAYLLHLVSPFDKSYFKKFIFINRLRKWRQQLYIDEELVPFLMQSTWRLLTKQSI